jgi:dCTP diphosphatase
MRKVLDPEQYHPEYKRSQRESSWDDFNFLEMDQKLANNPNYDMNKNKAYRSPRRIALCIQSRIGLISDLFLSRPESESAVGLPQWSESEVSRLSSSLAIMCVLLACLARATNRNLGQVIKDKMEKNERKYPADRSRGSSAKYTAYQARPQLIPSLPSLILIVSSALLGYFLGRRR